MKKLFYVLLAVILGFGSCKKEEEPKKVYKYHCVADDFECRKGMWVNVSPLVSSVDTLIFHTPTTFTNYSYNKYTGYRVGIFNREYKFEGINLVFYYGYDNKPFDNPLYKETRYNEETGIFSIVIDNYKDLVYDYKRVK